jgi:hypothetical protein
VTEGVGGRPARSVAHLGGWRLGGLALVFYLVHAAGHVTAGQPSEAFWACHLGALLVGVGLLTVHPLPCAVGFLWLCVGDGFWALDLATGGELIPTSLLTHVGGLVIGGVGVLRMGMPRHAALVAIGLFFALQIASRALTDPATNLNLAHSVWAGWEGVFPSYPVYELMLLSIGFASFRALEWLARRWFETRDG